MFCSNCGRALNANLNYCSSCGTRVEAKEPTVIRSGSTALGIGAVAVAIIGLMVFMPVMAQVLRSPMTPPAQFLILALYLLTVIVMFSVLLWQSRRGTTEIASKGNRTSEGFGGHEAFRGINTAQLQEPTERPASVTEHTTKTLDKVPYR